MNFENVIQDVVHSIKAAWNTRDFSALEENYLTNDVTVHSSNILKVYPQAKEATLVGKAAVIKYWSELMKSGGFEIEILEFLTKTRQASAICCYSKDNKEIKVDISLNQYGKIESLRITDL